ncbi:hypothetical protein [Pediococcus stilesii]|uniref:Uncharacterized protein n=1 Tax=Pediococcus stilesii TaxID=331679 RepID=A0A0R2L577_9LACO|nr:hypothetical protein [Pediococcus stilesii]KRN93975.1 hypothetical protein IV81_GL001833 [Pediococcus stilesii]TLQ05779.1 hypothetical protein FEZ51_00950 [Pediococcus stilesii]
MAKIDVKIIDQPTAKAMLVEFKSQRQDNVPVLKHPGHYILPDYKLTRQRKAFKIRKHTYLTKKFRSYVALDSANGHTLWMRNFGSLSEAVFWLETGMKIGDTDTDARFSFKDWQLTHVDEIEELKEELRQKSKVKQDSIE